MEASRLARFSLFWFWAVSLRFTCFLLSLSASCVVVYHLTWVGAAARADFS